MTITILEKYLRRNYSEWDQKRLNDKKDMNMPFLRKVTQNILKQKWVKSDVGVVYLRCLIIVEGESRVTI